MECWQPPPDFKFPFPERRDGNRMKRMYLGRQHLQNDEYDSEKRFGCFEYSQLLGGIFFVVGAYCLVPRKQAV